MPDVRFLRRDRGSYGPALVFHVMFFLWVRIFFDLWFPYWLGPTEVSTYVLLDDDAGRTGLSPLAFSSCRHHDHPLVLFVQYVWSVDTSWYVAYGSAVPGKERGFTDCAMPTPGQMLMLIVIACPITALEERLCRLPGLAESLQASHIVWHVVRNEMT